MEKWTFSAYVHVFTNKEKTGHETIVIETVFEETKMFTTKSLIESIKAEVVKRGKIFDYIVVIKIKPFFEQTASKKLDTDPRVFAQIKTEQIPGSETNSGKGIKS